MGFTKLDSGIVDSSVWSEPLATRVVWVTMLAKCDKDGMVRCARSGLLRAANVPAEEFDRALASLEAPDPESRTRDNEGRRVQEVEGGWLVLNHGKYRKFSYSDNPESERKRIYRGKRDKVGHVPKRPKNVRDISVSVSSSSLISLSSSSPISWIGISQEDITSWTGAYPACNVRRELAAMIEWIKANPARGKKSNYRRFIVNWLSRAQDAGGDLKNAAKIGKIEAEKLVGSARRSLEDDFTDEARPFLPKINEEFDSKGLLDRGIDRKQYISDRLKEIFMEKLKK